MIRKSILSVFGGALVGLVVTFGIGARAECGGSCQDSHQSGECYATFEGCRSTYSCPY